ncbi:periplasmic sensor signal transduction histidine kinase [Alcaligenes faecalis subsp. faecalis NCIB 8687]|uniref:histidine kinase n=1 Tax=Alcaligenes faecalis TaxID=511 RepID=Q6WB57_ALCFA|nr:signal transduction protein [Alcaligenes faecalis subsp. faecalis NCIB 8687]EJC61964.1 periplasmic sensor signal transduction histidine kinase [Alcaligenes faecalis subsp. faecalis NCIB 8687]
MPVRTPNCFSRLSFRYKVPLALAAAIVVTEVVVGSTLVHMSYSGMVRDMQASAADLSRVLALSIREPLIRDDVWRVYEALRMPIDAREADSGLQDVIVLDREGSVFAASDPRRFPVLDPLQHMPANVRHAISQLNHVSGSLYFDFPGLFSELPAVVATTVRSEDSGVAGYVVATYDSEFLRARIIDLVLRVVLISVPGLILLLVLGWVFGDRIARPLSQLELAMQKVGHEDLAAIRASLTVRGLDETARLSRQFDDMLSQLQAKQNLERQMLVTQRLAAVGRVAAGVAHEINNPLGGMLNALDTLEKHGSPDPLTQKTVGLVSRGLSQIRATVSALLVEARLDSPLMTLGDWEDLRTLIEPQLEQRQVHLVWDVPDLPTLDLPAHLIRQLTLNLLLNARNAVDSGGTVACVAVVERSALSIQVSNTGQHIPEELLPNLFEPYQLHPNARNSHSYGLGLWVTYQIVNQLRGSIQVVSQPGYTSFVVGLPLNL